MHCKRRMYEWVSYCNLTNGPFCVQNWIEQWIHEMHPCDFIQNYWPVLDQLAVCCAIGRASVRLITLRWALRTFGHKAYAVDQSGAINIVVNSALAINSKRTLHSSPLVNSVELRNGRWQMQNIDCTASEGSIFCPHCRSWCSVFNNNKKITIWRRNWSNRFCSHFVRAFNSRSQPFPSSCHWRTVRAFIQ